MYQFVPFVLKKHQSTEGVQTPRQNPIFVKNKKAEMMKASKLNISNMNDFELKGVLMSFIGSAKRQQLIPIFEFL